MLVLIIAMIICAKLLAVFIIPIAVMFFLFGQAPNLTFHLTRLWSKFFCWGYNARPVRVFGQENISRYKPHIFISNHQCWMDGIILWAWLPVKFRWLLGKDWVENPLVDFILKAADSFLYQPNDKQNLDSIVNRIRGGRNAVYFAERDLNNHLGDFKALGFEIAWLTGVPIIPVSISGTKEKFRDDLFMPRQSDVVIHYGTPINPRDYERNQINNLMSDVREVIKRHLPENYYRKNDES